MKYYTVRAPESFKIRSLLVKIYSDSRAKLPVFKYLFAFKNHEPKAYPYYLIIFTGSTATLTLLSCQPNRQLVCGYI